MAPGRAAVLDLYRKLIRETKKWKSYNYRMYTLRKIRHEFRENQKVEQKESIANLYKDGQEQLEMIKRQAAIGNMYATKPLIIEKVSSSTAPKSAK